MSRKILFIIAGALLFLLLLGLLWFWLLQRPAAEPSATGGFGTSTDRAAGGAGAGGPAGNAGRATQGGAGNAAQDDLVITAGGNYSTSLGGGTGGVGGPVSISGGTIGTGSPITIPTATTTPGGTLSGARIVNFSERPFNATEINRITGESIDGTPLISTTPQPPGLETSGLIVGAAAAGCLAQYVLHEAAGLLQANTKDRVTALSGGPYVAVLDLNASAKLNNNKFKSVEECLVKTIARAAIDQITRSVVNWINSGFNGKPSFVTNFNQYFASVADQAAGEFIRGSSLSFLCSPFSAQIKIAIAQSYANRKGSAAGSCSLNKVTGNINSFLNGNWGAGGWGGLLQLTMAPINNPYGAYGYAEISRDGAISRAQENARSGVSASGFISLQKCDASKGQSVGKGNCQITTPGQIIHDSLSTALSEPIRGLNLAQNINDIINALVNQVMVKTIYGGLGNALNGITNPLAPAIDQAASQQAKALLEQLRGALTRAGQYGSVQQGSIVDLQNAQANLNNAYNCWTTVASSTNDITQRTEAVQKAKQTDQAIAALEARIGAHNKEIERANASLAAIQNLQSQVIFAATPQDVAAAGQAVAATAAGGGFITEADVTTAQQNRATLQQELGTRNQETEASLTQCKALLGT